jgi:hypothetical protein
LLHTAELGVLVLEAVEVGAGGCGALGLDELDAVQQLERLGDVAERAPDLFASVAVHALTQLALQRQQFAALEEARAVHAQRSQLVDVALGRIAQAVGRLFERVREADAYPLDRHGVDVGLHVVVPLAPGFDVLDA